MILDRQIEVVAQRGGAADGDDRAALVQELLDRRQGRRGRQVSLHGLELRGNRRVAAASTATTTTTAAATAAPDRHIAREDDDVVLGLEIPRIEILRIHDLERNL